MRAASMRQVLLWAGRMLAAASRHRTIRQERSQPLSSRRLLAPSSVRCACRAPIVYVADRAARNEEAGVCA
ncbi:uncharacterized protein C8Q71DRAFT_746902 [Rhodofomes roseus]|uniref:Secreted protein n=1 Tax=Rhodofomes roseus TaxID=34475 RepID=A0ABQ8KPS5_9APHY|nr:uncharacterized protein C8Q71DRAFT_746902 [Rhodofomes roseus]KAH9840316.1 hypothetical protein C8Q71DRAFT_746902 [Rhodofomes roseus]